MNKFLSIDDALAMANGAMNYLLERGLSGDIEDAVDSIGAFGEINGYSSGALVDLRIRIFAETQLEKTG